MRPQFPCTNLQNTVLLLQLAFTRKRLTPLPTLSFFSPLAPKIYGKETEYSLYPLKNTADGPRAPGKLRGNKILRLQDKNEPLPNGKNKGAGLPFATCPYQDSYCTGSMNVLLTKESGSSDLYRWVDLGHFSDPTRCQGGPGRSSSSHYASQ